MCNCNNAFKFCCVCENPFRRPGFNSNCCLHSFNTSGCNSAYSNPCCFNNFNGVGGYNDYDRYDNNYEGNWGKNKWGKGNWDKGCGHENCRCNFWF